jgi:acetyltransferase-like isoleucine patch superfamily enzyme
VEIDINCVFEGRVELGDGVRIGANCVIRNATLGAGTKVAAFSQIEDTVMGEACVIGPYARTRPGTVLGADVHLGNFVEVKNSNIADHSKANHLAYVGDADIGQRVNVGAGTITCNYDGANKFRTIIEDDVFIGSDTQLVAPVRVGRHPRRRHHPLQGRPAEQLTVSRAKQVSVAGWKRPVKPRKPDPHLPAGPGPDFRKAPLMCGIVTAIARRNIVPVLLEGLRKLEYRGYDSAGLAVLKTEGSPNSAPARRRPRGRTAAQADATGLSANIGIAHTRWATHGVPSERNAHPHISGGLAVVHNGIIENFEELRSGCRPRATPSRPRPTPRPSPTCSTTSSRPSPTSSTRCAPPSPNWSAPTPSAWSPRPTQPRHRRPQGLAAAAGHRRRRPLRRLRHRRAAAGHPQGGLPRRRRRGRAHPRRLPRHPADGTPVERPVNISSLSADAVELGKYRHYMQKEIFEQPQALANTLEIIAGGGGISPQIFGAEAVDVFKATRRVLILACGTSYHAGLTARYWLESVAKIPAPSRSPANTATANRCPTPTPWSSSSPSPAKPPTPWPPSSTPRAWA